MAKLTSKEMHAKIEEARNRFRAFNTKTFRHYKGGIYEIAEPHAFEIDVDTGDIRVRYHRIGGPDYSPAEHSIPFSRRIEEFFDTVEVPERDVVMEETDMVTKPRFVPVHKVDRYETLAEIKERG